MDISLLNQQLEAIDQETEALEYKVISKDISNSYLWVLCALGIPGNIFTIVSILTMGKATTATIFVALLASCDMCALIAKLIGRLLYENMVYFGDVGCKLEFIQGCLSTMANWALVLITLERFFAVCYPLKKVYLFTKRRSYIITAIIFSIIFAIFVLVFCVMYEGTQDGYSCGTKKEYTKIWVTFWYWTNVTIFLILPFLITMTLTALIIHGLYTSRRDRRSMLQKDGQGNVNENNRKLIKEAERTERMITIMLIMAAILFVLLSLPACIHLLARPKTEDPVLEAKWELFQQITFVLQDSTHAINFFLYFVSSKRFRNHFISLVTCKRFRARGDNSGSEASNATENSKISTI